MQHGFEGAYPAVLLPYPLCLGVPGLHDHFLPLSSFGPGQLQHREAGREVGQGAPGSCRLQRDPGLGAPVTGCWRWSSWLPSTPCRKKENVPSASSILSLSLRCCFGPSVYLSLCAEGHPTTCSEGEISFLETECLCGRNAVLTRMRRV